MVTIRRAPAAPRTSSEASDDPSKATSSSKAASHHTLHSTEQSSLLMNGKSRESPHDGSREDGSRDAGGPQSKKNKPGRRSKNGGRKRKDKDKHANLADVLLRYLLLFFTIYSLAVCPHDSDLKSPICRGLSEYRRLILEPYVYPAVNNALSHPSVLPYVDRTKPFANRVIQIAGPVVLRTQREWNHRIAPQWNKVIVPQYRKYIVPQYQKYITPHVERASAIIEPYFLAIGEKYESLVGPHVRLVVSSASRYQRAVRPYILLAADRTYSGYQTTRPYLHPVWQRIKQALKQLLIFLRAQRRQFVDPHVAKIWERIKELSRGDDETFMEQSPSALSVSQVPVETTVDTHVVQEHSETLDEVEFSSSLTEHPSRSSTLSSPPTESSLYPHHPQGADITVEAALELSPSVTSSLVEPSSTSVHSSQPQESLPLSAISPSSTPTLVPHLDDDVDLEAFFADIGLHDEEPEAETEEAEAEPSLSAEQLEELRLEKLAKTAEKRRNITGRHAKWEEELENAIKEKKKILRKTLVAMRKAAVLEFRTNNDLQLAVDQLVENAEKLLKGAEAYLNNVKEESRTAKEKAALWTKVLEKVSTKFTEHVDHTEEVVNGWHSGYLDKEMAEVRQHTQEIKGLAESAQADIGYDYIWLADVSYHDWQRYHELLDRSNNFTSLAISIQNGTHPSPPINPVPDAMHELQLELEDVIAGFETRLRHIKQNGFKILDSLPEHKEEAEQTGESLQPPEVSILPVPKEDESDSLPVLGSERFVIGRGKVEVEEAFARREDTLNRNHGQKEVASSAPDETNVADPRLGKPNTVHSTTPLHAEL